jgi:hypothetical protein
LVAISQPAARNFATTDAARRIEKRPLREEKQAKSVSLRKISAGIHLLLKNGLGTIFYVD